MAEGYDDLHTEGKLLLERFLLLMYTIVKHVTADVCLKLVKWTLVMVLSCNTHIYHCCSTSYAGAASENSNEVKLGPFLHAC